MVGKSDSLNKAWHTQLAEISRGVDYHRMRVVFLNRIDRMCVVVMLLFLVLSGAWVGFYGLDVGFLVVFSAVSAGALMVAYGLSRQVQRHMDVVDELISLQAWATGALMTADNLADLTAVSELIEKKNNKGRK
ncbi:hypothetical protein [Budvicia aquatica]|uniref:Uncharacterized protein n=1 Tax=Budvicia aquatica TaxID=82979 RepID=A0A2C6C5B4_9GAMM|nr:hypothetical protein [Budvicia aquatica]PHI31530.1 hypothetical protein CRN84_20410 [Budvicia aquatica]VFS51984.1 Uncharacterised protein [Budvicia aquatica]